MSDDLLIAQWDDWEVEMSDETIQSLLRIESTSLEGSRLLPAPPEPPRSTTCVPDNALSPEQRAILKLVASGRSIFFTGSAGTGKSVLLREIIRYFRDKYATLHPPQLQQQEQEQPLLELAITASTGIASVNIDGFTLHPWAGIGLGKEDVRVLTAKLVASHSKAKARERASQERQITALERWKNVRTLIIDEISMIDAIIFDKLEYIARYFRKSNQPFGGIQLIISGDFCQLPPIMDEFDGLRPPTVYAFEANSWPDCIGPPVLLKHVFRQKDQRFVDLLNAMRLGYLSHDGKLLIKRCDRRVTYNDGIEPTEIYPTRAEVDCANSQRLNKLLGDEHRFYARNSVVIYLDFDPEEEHRLIFVDPAVVKRADTSLDRLVVSREIPLKVGAQVMLIKNLVQGRLVNGTKGRVEDFMSKRDAHKRHIRLASQCEHSSGEDRDVTRKRTFVELRGPPLDKAGLWDGRWPLVRFETGQELLCDLCIFDVKSTGGLLEAIRFQVPLILAWALSVHKSQGQTLQRVRVDLERAFANGQAYVALSRATSLDTLEVVHFEPSQVIADIKVLKWYNELNPVELHVESPPSVDETVQLKAEMVDDDAQYWATFGDDSGIA